MATIEIFAAHCHTREMLMRHADIGFIHSKASITSIKAGKHGFLDVDSVDCHQMEDTRYRIPVLGHHTTVYFCRDAEIAVQRWQMYNRTQRRKANVPSTPQHQGKEHRSTLQLHRMSVSAQHAVSNGRHIRATPGRNTNKAARRSTR